AQALSKSAKDVMGASKDNPNADQKNRIYKKALEDQYGIQVTIPPGMTNTHLDRTFDMFGSVPQGDAKQDKLKKLTYVKDGMAGSGSYNRTTFEIKMGDFGDASGEENYQVDGTVLPANSFDVTTLHEIGHAVDNKNSFMKNNGSKPGCGGWEAQDVDKVTAAYLPECKSTARPSDKVTDDMLKQVIKAALSAGTTAKPDEIGNEDWTKIVDFLTKKCLPIRAASKPWFKSSQVVVGGKVYQEAYSNQWWSYDAGARGTTKVNSYQWRAPGEWFAEVYAISWLKKTKPPSGVDASAAAFMWQR
ncbi:MAG: hypothetical protein JOZ05_16930, partial [Acetobacteraceae bacterium]|nr:hypothetical protein [Acetobacteraceae bacterium]